MTFANFAQLFVGTFFGVSFVASVIILAIGSTQKQRCWAFHRWIPVYITEEASQYFCEKCSEFRYKLPEGMPEPTEADLPRYTPKHDKQEAA